MGKYLGLVRTERVGLCALWEVDGGEGVFESPLQAWGQVLPL